jgi:hypothetical protein
VEGEIVSITEMQATDMESGLPLYWDSAHTRPKMMPAIELQTTLRADSADDGRRMVHLSGNRYTAVKKATGRIDEGDWLRLTFTEFSDREPAKKGWNRAKLFRAEYRATAKGIDLKEPSQPAATVISGPGVAQGPGGGNVFDSLDEEQRAALRALGVAGA